MADETNAGLPPGLTPITPSAPATPSLPAGLTPISGSPAPSPTSSLPAGLTPLGGSTRTPDTDQPWYKEAWDKVNAPLISPESIQNFFGDENAPGWRRGVYNVAAGLSSPLSIGLTIATFGSGALAEAGGQVALRGVLTAEEIAEATKGAEVFSKAARAGINTAEAFKAAGINPEVVSKAARALGDAGMGLEDLNTTGAITRGGAAAFRALGVPVQKADKVAKGLQAMVDSGFTIQSAIQAAEASPKVLDALKEGDYDRAGELGVEALSAGGFAALGANATLRHAGGLIEDAKAKMGLAVKPSEENLEIRKNIGIHQADVIQGDTKAAKTVDALRQEFKTLTPADREAAFYLTQAGGDVETVKQRHDMLAEAMGKGEQKFGGNAPAPPTHGAPIKVFRGHTSEDPLEAVRSGEGGVGGITLSLSPDPDTAAAYAGAKENARVSGFVLRPDLRTLDASAPMPEQVAKSAIRTFSQKARELFPKENPEDLFQRYSAERGPGMKGLNDPTLNYVDVVDATRRLLQDAKKPVREGLIDFQKNIAGHDYDGVTNTHANRPAIELFPEEVTGRSLSEQLKPATPARQLTPDEADAFKGGVSGAEAERTARQQELINRRALALSKNYSDKERASMLAAYRAAANPTPEMAALSSRLRDHFNDIFERGKSKGILKNFLQDYITQLWEKDADNPATKQLLAEHDSGAFRTNVSMARKRVFENAFEGQLLGRKLAVTDPITLVGNQMSKVDRAIAARNFLERLRDSHVRASDGRPMVALSGTGQLLEEPGKDPAVLVNPNSIRSIRIADSVIQGLKDKGDFDRLLKSGQIHKVSQGVKEPFYTWATDDYRTVDHPAFHDWNWAALTHDGTNVLVKGELRAHPEITQYLNRFLGTEKSKLSEVAPVKAALGVGSELKHLQLSLSPFHIAQEGLRALMTGISPITRGYDFREEILNNPKIRTAVEEGLTLGKDYRGVQDFQEGVGGGHSKILAKIPFLNRLQGHMQTFLFDKYIPALKVRAYEALEARYRSAHPDWSDRAVAREAAAATNERFGGINYQQMGRSAGTQDFLRLATLAPDWMESEVRFMKRIASGDKIALQDTARIAAVMWASARVLNYLTTGKPHNEAPFGVALQDSNGKEKVYSIRTLPTDMLHAASDPLGFLRGRISPLGRIGVEAYSGRDYLGRKLTPGQTFIDIAGQQMPIPAQEAVQAIEGKMPRDLTNIDQVVKASGATATVYRTEAEKKAAELASNRSEGGPVDPAQLRRHQLKMRWEDDLRAGKMAPSDIHDMVENGSLPVKEAKEIIKTVQETKEMDPSIASLYTRAKRLPMTDFLQVFDLATPNEKVALTPLIIKKKQAYFKKANKEMTPDERRTDPTYRRLRELFPQEPNF